MRVWCLIAISSLCAGLILAQSATLVQPADGLKPLSTTSGQEARPKPLPVEEAFAYYISETAPDRLRVTWHPAPGHYLYHHGFNFALEGDPSQASSVRFELPEGLAKTDQFFGEVTVYYDRVSIDLSLPPAHRGKTLILHYQGCAEWGFCYPPQRDLYPLPE